MLTTSTFQGVSRWICYSFQPWLFLPYSLVFLNSLFMFHWYFFCNSLVFLDPWPRHMLIAYFLDRDHPGGQQDGVYNSRLFVKPGTDEVRFWTKSYFNTKENCFAMPSAWLAPDHVGRKIRTRPNIFKLWWAKKSFLNKWHLVFKPSWQEHARGQTARCWTMCNGNSWRL